MKFAINDRVKFTEHKDYILSGKTGVVVGFSMNPGNRSLIRVKLDEPLNEHNCDGDWNSYKYIDEELNDIDHSIEKNK